jgi:hypothetical protein
LPLILRGWKSAKSNITKYTPQLDIGGLGASRHSAVAVVTDVTRLRKRGYV